MHNVFVYGTLKKNGPNHFLLEGSEVKGEATVCGTLYDFGLPGFKRVGRGLVHGELYRVDNETLSRLDDLEGYSEHNPKSLYKRVLVPCVYGGAMSTLAFIYEVNLPTDMAEVIKGGKW
jgi:gamma-glutamylcyclotransferase (GGCT)/AIG2-like uncharacterized protein YtfP